MLYVKSNKVFIHLVLIFYFLAVTNSLYFIMDIIMPATKKAADEGFPCAGHDCACTTKEQCETKCCCFPREEPPISGSCNSESGEVIQLGYFSIASCAGLDSIIKNSVDLHTPFIQPDLTFTPILIGGIRLIKITTANPVVLRGDKIPI